MQRVFLLLFLLFLSLSSYAQNGDAKTLHPVIELLKLEAIKTAEHNGDELYLDVTTYPSKQEAEHYRLPKYPLHWESQHLEKVKKVSIWDHELKEGQAVTVILSLVEQDTPPWNTDDLIGSVRIRLKNDEGQLETSWSMPNRVDAPVSILTKYGRAEKFELLGENSNYDLYLLLRAKD